MIPAFRWWRAIWLTTVAPKAASSLLIRVSVSITHTFLLFRLERQFIHVTVHEAHLDGFDWRLMGRRDLEIINNEVSQAVSDKIFEVFAQ